MQLAKEPLSWPVLCLRSVNTRAFPFQVLLEVGYGPVSDVWLRLWIWRRQMVDSRGLYVREAAYEEKVEEGSHSDLWFSALADGGEEAWDLSGAGVISLGEL